MVETELVMKQEKKRKSEVGEDMLNTGGKSLRGGLFGKWALGWIRVLKYGTRNSREKEKQPGTSWISKAVTGRNRRSLGARLGERKGI